MSRIPKPWQPNPRWADPLLTAAVILVGLVGCLLLMGSLNIARRPAERATLQGRLLEVAVGGPSLLRGGPSPREWQQARKDLKEPWDRALLSVLSRELGADPAPPTPPPGEAGEVFSQAWRAAYEGGPLPSIADRTRVHRLLGNGYAADLLEARLRDREGGGDALRIQARETLLKRMLGLGLGLLAALGLAIGGFGFLLWLWSQRRVAPSQPLPTWGMSSQAALLVLLFWYLGFNLFGSAVAGALRPWPGLRWLALPLGTTLHATWGVGLICWAEGLSLRELWRRVAPGRLGRDAAWAVAFLALALFLVATVGLLTSFVLRPEQSPQRDLQELLRGASGWSATLLLLLPVAVIAPCFEELLFRGFLLPVLAQRQSFTAALIITALLFGAIHLQPTGLPVLSTLGLVLGLAMRHTGSLRTPILVHACWNAGQFLLMRALA